VHENTKPSPVEADEARGANLVQETFCSSSLTITNT
jgi:hypothetical protein